MNFKAELLREAEKVSWGEFEVIREAAERMKAEFPNHGKEIKDAMYEAMEDVKKGKIKEKMEHELRSIWLGFDRPTKAGFRHVQPHPGILLSEMMKNSQLPIQRIYISDLGRDTFTATNILVILEDIAAAVQSKQVPGTYVRICQRCPDPDLWRDILSLVKECNGDKGGTLR